MMMFWYFYIASLHYTLYPLVSNGFKYADNFLFILDKSLFSYGNNQQGSDYFSEAAV